MNGLIPPAVALELVRRVAEMTPNERTVLDLPTGERLGVTRFVRKAYGRVSKPYEGLEEFAWAYDVWTPATAADDAERGWIREGWVGWRFLPLGAPGEAAALRLLAGEPYAAVAASRAPVRGVGA